MNEQDAYLSVHQLTLCTIQANAKTQASVYLRSVEVPIFIHLKGNKPLLESLSTQSKFIVEVDTVQTEHAERHCDAQQHDLIFQVLVLLDFLSAPRYKSNMVSFIFKSW